jgi:hypothetical protein
MRESAVDTRMCPSAEIAVVRAEARRDLKAMLAPSAIISAAIVIVGIWRGGAALWPVWSTLATTMTIALAVALWGTYIRGWRVMRAHRHCAPARGKTAAATSAHPSHV